MEMVVGGLSDSQTEARFRTQLFSGLEGHEPGDVAIRFFDLGGEFIFAFIFTTDAVEPATKRTRLKIAIGFAISDYAYVSDTQLPVYIGRLIWKLLNRTFGTSLPGAGAASLIEQIVTGEGKDSFLKIEQELGDLAFGISTVRPARLGPAGRWARRLLWRFGRELSAPPKCLLVLDDNKGNAVNAAFDALIFEIVERKRRTIRRASTASQVVNGEIAIRHLDLGSKIREGVVVRGPGKNYVALY
ncbi:MAG TPA: hypothetical protein VG889_07130 [Rhizomicrobium sp.]|nr:hypothetical protein [Rhizomicrobium sp.]